ncbi:MAG: hypothetical protein NC827_02355 [Candidatus Omnitrophica bacterium]|nr:hypothetical protein [Candidatus Omnitrophota bacterium]MCM8802137.1 hypothetical protein [Candidatus Omnitrophota bacterium]
MKKIIMALVLINLICLTNLKAQNQKTDLLPQREKIEKLMKENSILREKLKDILHTQKRIKEIEREEIEKDPELKNLHIQIMNLRMQLIQKIQEKLKDDQEYQRLKERMREIEEKIKKMREEVEKKIEKKGGEKI